MIWQCSGFALGRPGIDFIPGVSLLPAVPRVLTRDGKYRKLGPACDGGQLHFDLWLEAEPSENFSGGGGHISGQLLARRGLDNLEAEQNFS